MTSEVVVVAAVERDLEGSNRSSDNRVDAA